MRPDLLVRVTADPIGAEEAVGFVSDPAAGGTCVFLGTVRDHSDAGAVTGLTYEAWVDRAERVGNLNYPDEARRKRLKGQLVISVAVRRDGSVENTRIIQSSGIPLLDSTALRIVQLSVPFPPLPKTDENIDILHVTRTWQFLPGGEVRDQ